MRGDDNLWMARPEPSVRSLARAAALAAGDGASAGPARLLGGLVGGLLGNAEMLADLAPERAGLERAQHGGGLGRAAGDRLGHVGDHLLLLLGAHRHARVRLLRAPGIGARPAVDVGLVDDAAQPARAPDHGVARGAELLGDLRGGKPVLLQGLQPLVARRRPARLHRYSPLRAPPVYWSRSLARRITFVDSGDPNHGRGHSQGGMGRRRVGDGGMMVTPSPRPRSVPLPSRTRACPRSALIRGRSRIYPTSAGRGVG